MNSSMYYQVHNFEKVISVGDGLWDFISAKNLGLEFIGFGTANQKMLLENGAQIICNDLTEFELRVKIAGGNKAHA
ncbi:hypothetical protein K3G39_00930 [Pontibacter sp. HSC-14F20]|uniref:hypothetical protein n=1 Tax=Pontibacter sp. HSC-14F20 TaxID=2864136 RepID=UPI001C73117D|nr:hypothetical protein [Pontibacter sp. HSC-14F20]MBX0331793.1 hypothetical protein [Pontibacter sp. HSC-14F20]